MTDQEAIGGNQPPAEEKPGTPANPSEPSESDDIEFTPEQKKKLGKLLSAERKAVREQFKDYPDLQKKLKEMENAKLTESERLQKEKEEAIKERDTVKNQLSEFAAKEMRITMYAEYKTKDGQSLPIGLMKYVTGSDEKSIATSIESIAADFGTKLEKRKNIGNPTPAGGEATQGKNDFMNNLIYAAAGRGGSR